MVDKNQDGQNILTKELNSTDKPVDNNKKKVLIYSIEDESKFGWWSIATIILAVVLIIILAIFLLNIVG